MDRFLKYETVTYYNQLLQMLVYALATIWFARSLFTRGFVHTTRTAALKST